MPVFTDSRVNALREIARSAAVVGDAAYLVPTWIERRKTMAEILGGGFYQEVLAPEDETQEAEGELLAQTDNAVAVYGVPVEVIEDADLLVVAQLKGDAALFDALDAAAKASGLELVPDTYAGRHVFRFK